MHPVVENEKLFYIDDDSKLRISDRVLQQVTVEIRANAETAEPDALKPYGLVNEGGAR